MKEIWLRGFYRAAYYSGVVSLLYWINRHKSIAIAYHNVLPDELFDGRLHLGVSHSASVFDAQLRVIARRWRGRPSGACLITFDDGYENQYYVAAPILKRHELSAIFFVTLDLVLDGATLWPDRCLLWLSYVPDGTYKLLGEAIVLQQDESRRQCWAGAWDKIKRNYDNATDLISDMDAAYPFDRLSVDSRTKSARFHGMTRRQVVDLARQGHLIGCHSGRHDILSCLTRPALAEDFRRCEEAIGPVFNCLYYSYPFGGPEEVTVRELEACRRSQFRRAFLNIPGSPSGYHDADYAIPRIMLPNTGDQYVINAKLSGLESLLKGIGRRMPWRKQAR